MRPLFALLFLAGCPNPSNAPSDAPDTSPAPPYICPGDGRTPCMFAPETCEQSIDCEAACSNTLSTCEASNNCETDSTNATTYLCGYATLVVQSCLATCRGTVAANCAERTYWVCGEHYNTCGDINTCWEAGAGDAR